MTRALLLGRRGNRHNVLTVLNVLLKKAGEWDVIERMPCLIRLLPIPRPSAAFYDFEELRAQRVLCDEVGDDATVHAPESGGDRERDSVTRMVPAAASGETVGKRDLPRSVVSLGRTR